MTKTDQKAHYLRLYKAADEILKQPDNPCEIKVVDGQTTCRKSRETNGAYGYRTNTLCCNGCNHHHPEKGCTVQSLGCKLGWCYCGANSITGMKNEDHPVFQKIFAIKEEAVKLGVPMGCRASFEQNFDPKWPNRRWD